jgi:hypothetical protein
MKFKEYDQFLCPNKHYWERHKDMAYDNPLVTKCPFCLKPASWYNRVETEVMRISPILSGQQLCDCGCGVEISIYQLPKESHE